MNVLGCNDKFFNIFINLFVFIAAFSIAFLHNMVPGRMSLNYFMCTGEDPADYQYMESKVIWLLTKPEFSNEKQVLKLAYIFF